MKTVQWKRRTERCTDTEVSEAKRKKNSRFRMRNKKNASERTTRKREGSSIKAAGVEPGKDFMIAM
ncbi:MAG: hypothetical protein IJJ34_07735, partial [Clostridia bacterium]|nr:hypothetical protein [Clostridia bacterium]